MVEIDSFEHPRAPAFCFVVGRSQIDRNSPEEDQI
jgi:hypothetical protein